MGVRISWLMLLRKVLLDLLADSAMHRASSAACLSRWSSLLISCSACTCCLTLRTRSRLSAAKTSSTVRPTKQARRMVTVLPSMLMVLTAMASAGINSMSVVSKVLTLVSA